MGKSTLGNLLCPSANFKTLSSTASVTSTTEQAHVKYPECGLLLVLLNTMGLGNTAHQPKVVQQKITDGIILLVGRVDFFFLCIKKEHFTEENYLIITYNLFFIFISCATALKRLKYLFRAILSDQLLGNLWLVVTHTKDLVDDDQAQAEWICDTHDNNKKFNHVLKMVGVQKVLFINNRSLKNKKMDDILAEGCESAKDLLLQVMQNNKPTWFTIESLKAAQKEYDDTKAAAEAERAAEVAWLRQVEIDTATALEKEKARLAIQQAKLQAELKLATARTDLEAKLRAEAEERLHNVPPPQVIHHSGKRGCVLS